MISFITSALLKKHADEYNDARVFSFASLNEDSTDISYLCPFKMGSVKEFNNPDNLTFDIWYKDYIENDETNYLMVLLILVEAIKGKDIFLLNDYMQDDKMMNLIESFIKYIKEIYGYSINIIKEDDDFDSLIEGEFSKEGKTKIGDCLDTISSQIFSSILDYNQIKIRHFSVF